MKGRSYSLEKYNDTKQHPMLQEFKAVVFLYTTDRNLMQGFLNIIFITFAMTLSVYHCLQYLVLVNCTNSGTYFKFFAFLIQSVPTGSVLQCWEEYLLLSLQVENDLFFAPLEIGVDVNAVCCFGLRLGLCLR